MAILARGLTFALMLTLASALDTFGLFGCPDFRKKTDSSVSYANAENISAMVTKFENSGYFFLILAAESEASKKFSCVLIQIRPGVSEIQYYENGTHKSADLMMDTSTGQLKAMLPKNLLNTPKANKDVVFTVVSYKDGIVVMKTCKPTFLSHYMLSSPADDYEVKGTLTSYKDGFVALKTCKNGFFTHFVSTYVMVDKTTDKSNLNMDCLGPIYDEKLKIQSWPKGICA